MNQLNWWYFAYYDDFPILSRLSLQDPVVTTQVVESMQKHKEKKKKLLRVRGLLNMEIDLRRNDINKIQINV